MPFRLPVTRDRRTASSSRWRSFSSSISTTSSPGAGRGAARRGNGALILERGWFDQTVDPRRYRLSPHVGGLARVLGTLLPRCDVVVLLQGEAEAIAARKCELSPDETRAQLDAWSSLVDRVGVRCIAIDTVQTPPDRAADCVMHFAESTPPVWRRISPTPSRLALRATGGVEALPALAIYEPSRLRAKVARRIAESALRYGLGRRVAPPNPLDHALVDTWSSGSGVVAMKSSNPGRWIVGVARDGRLEQVVKISATRDERLENEAVMLRLLEGRELGFSVPQLAFTRRGRRASRSAWRPPTWVRR